VHDLYAEIAAETNDPKVHEEIEGFLAELEGEQKTTDELRAALQG
jgi:hypothetical protein